jgi:hypothetical protein
MTEPFIWLRTNPSPRKPPQGYVQLAYNATTGAIEVTDEQGTTVPFDGAELSDTLDALSSVTLTPSTLLSVNSSGVPVALSYAATKTALSLNLVNNTSDEDKPVSIATQTALDSKQPLDATLTALAGQNFAASTVHVGTGVDTCSNVTLSAGSTGTVLGNSGSGAGAQSISLAFFTKAANTAFDPADLAGTSAFTAKQTFRTSDTTAASIVLPHGVAPTTPVNGDKWTTTAGEFTRVNGTTRTVVFSDSPTITTPTLSANNTHDFGTAGTALRNVYAATGFHVTTGQFYNMIGTGTLSGGADGIFRLKNVAGTVGTGSLCFGGDGSTSARLQANGTEIQVKNGDGSAFSSLRAGTSKLSVLTVATLPVAATAGAGTRSFVSDATVTHALGVGTTVAGGGANFVPVYTDGTNWIIG